MAVSVADFFQVHRFSREHILGWKEFCLSETSYWTKNEAASSKEAFRLVSADGNGVW